MGSIERPQPHKGQWRVRIWWRDTEGRRRSTYVTAPTERGATLLAQARQSKELQDVEREKAGLLVRRRECPTLTEYVIEHHRTIWLHAKAPYLRRQLALLGAHVEPYLGTMRLDAITKTHVAQCLSRMRAGRSGASGNRLLAALSKVLGHATEAGLVSENVCQGRGARLRVPEPPQAVERYSLEEVARIVDAALADRRSGRRWGPFIAIAAYTGARPSSIQRLKVADLRLDATPPAVVFRETKSGHDLEVPLVARLVEIVAPLVEGREPGAWLFPGGGVQGHIGDGYDPAWDRACAAAGVRALTFYALRRSFISGAIDAGVSLTMVRDLAGHSSLAITNRYAGSHTRRQQATELDAAWRGADVVQNSARAIQNEPQPPKT